MPPAAEADAEAPLRDDDEATGDALREATSVRDPLVLREDFVARDSFVFRAVLVLRVVPCVTPVCPALALAVAPW
jgi:hypothetical protein